MRSGCSRPIRTRGTKPRQSPRSCLNGVSVVSAAELKRPEATDWSALPRHPVETFLVAWLATIARVRAVETSLSRLGAYMVAIKACHMSRFDSHRAFSYGSAILATLVFIRSNVVFIPSTPTLVGLPA